MVLWKIIRIVLKILEILIVLALILYPWVVLGQNPITYYWNELKELWIVVQSWPVINRIVGVFT